MSCSVQSIKLSRKAKNDLHYSIPAQKIHELKPTGSQTISQKQEQPHYDHTRTKDIDLQRTSNQTISQKQRTIAL